MKTRVLRSLEAGSGQRRVDLFVRANGTFGFEEYRWDHEDRHWMKKHHRLHLDGS